MIEIHFIERQPCGLGSLVVTCHTVLIEEGSIWGGGIRRDPRLLLRHRRRQTAAKQDRYEANYQSFH
jgi:hypothetical protein